MTDMYTKCIHCGKPFREHRARLLSCPEEIEKNKIVYTSQIFQAENDIKGQGVLSAKKISSLNLESCRYLTEYLDDNEHTIDRRHAASFFGETPIAQLDQETPWIGFSGSPVYSSLQGGGHIEPCPTLDEELEEENACPMVSDEFYGPQAESESESAEVTILYTPAKRVQSWTIRAVYLLRLIDVDKFSPGHPSAYLIQHHTDHESFR